MIVNKTTTDFVLYFNPMDFQQKYLTEKMDETPSDRKDGEATEFISRQQNGVFSPNSGGDTGYHYVP